MKYFLCAARWMRLYQTRNELGQSALHTARSEEMVDFLLSNPDFKDFQKEMRNMLDSRDNEGNNVLATYVKGFCIKPMS